jgi:hypothetical protein
MYTIFLYAVFSCVFLCSQNSPPRSNKHTVQMLPLPIFGPYFYYDTQARYPSHEKITINFRTLIQFELKQATALYI